MTAPRVSNSRKVRVREGLEGRLKVRVLQLRVGGAALYKKIGAEKIAGEGVRIEEPRFLLARDGCIMPQDEIFLHELPTRIG